MGVLLLLAKAGYFYVFIPHLFHKIRPTPIDCIVCLMYAYIIFIRLDGIIYAVCCGATQAVGYGIFAKTPFKGFNFSVYISLKGRAVFLFEGVKFYFLAVGICLAFVYMFCPKLHIFFFCFVPFQIIVVRVDCVTL